MGSDGELAVRAASRLGLFDGLKDLFRRARGEAEEWTTEAYQRARATPYSWKEYGRNPPPPDWTMQDPRYVNVYLYHDLDRDTLVPGWPLDEAEIGWLTTEVRDRGDLEAARFARDGNAYNGKGSFITVTTDMVDAADPPGRGRDEHMLVSTFRVPRERLFDPRARFADPKDQDFHKLAELFSPGIAGQLPEAESGERYFLGNDLVTYKVSERINPFWAQGALSR